MNQDVTDKIAAAQVAVEKAASDLLAHAEGLAMLAMMCRHRDRHPEMEEGIHARHGFIRNRAADDAYWRMVAAAAVFAGAKESFAEAVEMPNAMLRSIRHAVEEVVGPDGGVPPPVPRVAFLMGASHPGVSPEQVHHQAWRSHLATSVRAQ